MGDKLTSILTSRRAWAAIAAIVVTVAAERFGLTPDKAEAIVQLASYWIIGESFRSSEGFGSLLDQIKSVFGKKDPPQ